MPSSIKRQAASCLPFLKSVWWSKYLGLELVHLRTDQQQVFINRKKNYRSQLSLVPTPFNSLTTRLKNHHHSMNFLLLKGKTIFQMTLDNHWIYFLENKKSNIAGDIWKPYLKVQQSFPTSLQLVHTKVRISMKQNKVLNAQHCLLSVRMVLQSYCQGITFYLYLQSIGI